MGWVQPRGFGLFGEGEKKGEMRIEERGERKKSRSHALYGRHVNN